MVTTVNNLNPSTGEISLTKDDLWEKCLLYIKNRIQEQAFQRAVCHYEAGLPIQYRGTAGRVGASYPMRIECGAWSLQDTIFP